MIGTLIALFMAYGYVFGFVSLTTDQGFVLIVVVLTEVIIEYGIVVLWKEYKGE